jgi:hypothetical protein
VLSHLPRTHFCWLPPLKVATTCSLERATMLNCWMRSPMRRRDWRAGTRPRRYVLSAPRNALPIRAPQLFRRKLTKTSEFSLGSPRETSNSVTPAQESGAHDLADCRVGPDGRDQLLQNEQRLRSGSKERSLHESVPSVRSDLSNTAAEPIGPTEVTDRDRACERDRSPATPAAIGLRRRLTRARSHSRDQPLAGPAGNSARP